MAGDTLSGAAFRVAIDLITPQVSQRCKNDLDIVLVDGTLLRSFVIG